MVSFQSRSIEVMALQIASQWQSPFKDGLVMRLGEGWEASNAEAIAAWLQSIKLTGRCKPVDIEHVRENMATLLRTQSEQLWERGSCPFPRTVPRYCRVKATGCRSSASGSMRSRPALPITPQN